MTLNRTGVGRSTSVRDIHRQQGARVVRIAVPQLSRIANFDDFDPLAQEPGVSLEMVPPGRPIPGGVDLIVLPGSKATLADLAFVRAQGWDIDLLILKRIKD